MIKFFGNLIFHFVERVSLRNIRSVAFFTACRPSPSSSPSSILISKLNRHSPAVTCDVSRSTVFTSRDRRDNAMVAIKSVRLDEEKEGVRHRAHFHQISIHFISFSRMHFELSACAFTESERPNVCVRMSLCSFGERECRG